MTVKLPIEPRTKNKRGVAEYLKERIPAVVYGRKQEPVSVFVERKEFEKTFKTAGESTVIVLEGLSAPIEVLVKDVTFAPIKGGIVHVDFYALEKGKEIVTHVPLHFIGEAPATKVGAVVNKVMHEVTVSCKATDLPAHIDVDLALLTEVESKITVADIVAPKGVKISEAPEQIVALAEEVEEVIEEETTIAAADVPAEQKGKVEDEGGEK
ncbi:MAG: 50S ribosomal protein L25 [Candidatus Paceibacterota bacterium]